MAYRESIQNRELKSNLNGAQFFWNIHKNVGYGYKNHRSDVMLVQFLLNTYFQSEGSTEKLIKVDGKFGGQTWRAIKNYQSYGFYSEHSGSYDTPVQDGCVSATNGTRFVSKRQKLPYTILLLNITYLWARSLYYHDIRKDPNIHKLLVEQLTGLPQVV